MVGWHHRLEGHDFEQAPGVDDGQRSLLPAGNSSSASLHCSLLAKEVQSVQLLGHVRLLVTP